MVVLETKDFESFPLSRSVRILGLLFLKSLFTKPYCALLHFRALLAGSSCLPLPNPSLVNDPWSRNDRRSANETTSCRAAAF